MGEKSTVSQRGLSPVVGGILLVGILVLLATVVGVLVTGVADTDSPAPNARLVLEPTTEGCQYELVHEGGDRIEGDRTRLVGVADPDVLDGADMTTGDSATVRPTDDVVRVLWQNQGAGTTEYPVATKSIDDDADSSPSWKCSSGTIYIGSSSGIGAIGGLNGEFVVLTAPGTISGLGPTRIDLTGDGSEDIPYVDDNGRVRITNETNTSTTLATDGDISDSIGTDKTRLWAGTWNGSDPSVFFVDQSHEEIYRVNETGPPVEVAAPSNGAQSVVGTGDIDGDGGDELVFADGSQALRYLEDDGTVNKVADGGSGSSTGIGSGSLTDFDGDGTESAVVVDGSNDVKITSESKKTIISAADAAKTPPTAADVDDDGNKEIVYIGKSNGKLKYIDDVEGSNTIDFIRDEDGNKIDASEETGAA
jgi:hypothetical protein